VALTGATWFVLDADASLVCVVVVVVVVLVLNQRSDCRLLWGTRRAIMERREKFMKISGALTIHRRHPDNQGLILLSNFTFP
jgi:hypothetical protein